MMKNLYLHEDKEIINILSDDPIFSKIGLSDKDIKLYNEISNLKLEIQEANNELDLMKNELKFIFRKYESLKYNGLNGLVLYDLIKGALFGNT